MNVKIIMKRIGIGVCLYLAVQIMFFLTNEKTTAAATDTDTDSKLDEAVQIYDEMERLSNNATEDLYIDESEREGINKVSQKGAMMFDDTLLEAGIVDNNRTYALSQSFKLC